MLILISTKIIKNQILDAIEEFEDYLIYELSLSKLTIAAYSLDIRQYINYVYKSKILNENSIMNLKSMDFYIKYIYNKHYSSATFARKISSLKSFIFYLHHNKKDLIDDKLLKYISNISNKKVNRIPKVYEYEKFSHILNMILKKNEKHFLLMFMILTSGFRVSEIISLKIQNFIQDNKGNINAVFFKGKGNKERTVPICKTSSDLIISLIQKEKLNNKDYFFHSKSSKIKSITRNTVYKITKKYFSDKDIHPHTMRHSFATSLLKDGIDISILQKILGHQNILSTQIYTKTNLKDTADLINKHPLLNNF